MADSSDGLTTAMDRFTLDDKQPKPPSKPIVNFPLPRELRDEIYSYLLGSDVVRYTPPTNGEVTFSQPYAKVGSRAHSYRFHTELLRVNKTIGSEAAEYLHSKNVFMPVRYSMPGFLANVHLWSVPIVADHALDIFEKRNLTVNIGWRSPPLSYGAIEFQEKCPQYQKGVILMLLDDLPKLWELLKFLCLASSPECVYFIDTRHLGVTKVRETLKLDVNVGTLKAAHQASILSGLQRVTGAGYNMTLSGFDDAHRVERVKLDMAPRIIWSWALILDMFDTIKAMKEHADSFVTNGHFRRGVERYHSILHHIDVLLMQRRNVATPIVGQTVHEVMLRWKHLNFDLTLSMIASRLRKGHSTKAFEDCERLISSHLMDLTTPIMHLRLKHLLILASLMEMEHQPISQHVGLLSEFGLEWRQLDRKGELADDALEFDAEILSWVAERASMTDFPIPADLVVQGLSIHILPFGIYDSQGEIEYSYTRPATLVGWQDKRHLAALVDEEKNRIQRMQRAHGYAVSTF